MKILLKLPLLLLLLGTPMSAAAGPELTVGEILSRPALGLEDLFRLAELTSPDLALAAADVRASEGRLRQAGAWPNPELELEWEDVSADDPAFRSEKLALSQTLPLGGRRGAAIAAARAGSAATREGALRSRREVLVRVHKWWAAQIHFREMDAALSRIIGEAERSLEIARARFEAQAAPESHVTRALLELYDLEVARQDLEGERARSAAEMKVIFGGHDVPLDRLTGSLDPDAEATSLPPGMSADLLDHPALRSARQGVAAAEAELRGARRERVPDLDLFVAYGRGRPTDERFLEGGVGISLPLFDRGGGRIAEMASLVARARHEERLAARELELALTAARLEHDTAHARLAHLTERIAPAAERALDQAREAYRAGRLMFLELIDAQRTATEVIARTMELRRDLALAEADLMGLLGAGPYADEGETR